jgi:hypothetical protein
MIELTLEQLNAVARDAETPPRVMDPSTHTKLVSPAAQTIVVNPKSPNIPSALVK